MSTYSVVVKRIFVEKRSSEGKKVTFPVWIRTMQINDGVFEYTVSFRSSLAKGPRYTVSRMAVHHPVSGLACTLFYGSTAAGANSIVRKERHLYTESHDEFQSWLVKCIGRRPAHNAVALLHGGVTG